MPVLRVGEQSPLAQLFNDVLRLPRFNFSADPGDRFAAKSKQGAAQLQQWIKDQLIANGSPGFSKRVGVDGIPGNQTWGLLCAIEQIPLITAQQIATAVGVNYPVRPAGLPASLSAEQMNATFGKIVFVPAATADNPERIRITNGWAQTHIVTAALPQTIGLAGSTASGNHAMHTRIKAQMQGLWQAWQNVGLMSQVSTFGGLWVPRFQRGSTSKLSNHSWGTAFDVNASSNALWHLPAFPGENGCLFEHAVIAAQFGFSWGGNFSRRMDGMHFEAVKVLSEAEVAQALAGFPPLG
jgi:D-alanyl-D-alanine carboxypeptidase